MRTTLSWAGGVTGPSMPSSFAPTSTARIRSYVRNFFTTGALPRFAGIHSIDAVASCSSRGHSLKGSGVPSMSVASDFRAFTTSRTASIRSCAVRFEAFASRASSSRITALIAGSRASRPPWLRAVFGE
jgi:hypothetical protein